MGEEAAYVQFQKICGYYSFYKFIGNWEFSTLNVHVHRALCAIF